MTRLSGQPDRATASNNNSRMAYQLDDLAPESLDMAFDQMDFNMPNDDLNAGIDGLSGIGAAPNCGAVYSQAQGQGEQS